MTPQMEAGKQQLNLLYSFVANHNYNLIKQGVDMFFVCFLDNKNKNKTKWNEIVLKLCKMKMCNFI